MVQNPSPPRIRPYRSWDLLQYAKRQEGVVHLNWTLNWTKLSELRTERTELWKLAYLIELNWTKFPKQIGG